MDTVRTRKLVGLAILVAFTAAEPAWAQDSVRLPQPTTIAAGESFQLDSQVMGGKREINVYLPPAYSTPEAKDKTYNVLYVIDGGVDQDFVHIAGLSQLASINADYEELIVVGIKTGTRIAELTHVPKDARYIRKPAIAGQSTTFLKHITDEVIPLVANRYRVGKRRAVVGESLAGLFITEVFLKTPATFTDYIIVSPSLWWDDRAMAKASEELLRKHDDKPRQLYITMADEGGTMQSGLDMVLASLKAVDLKNLKWQYVDRRKSHSHATIYHTAAHDALNRLFDVPTPDYGPPAWYMVEGGQPPKDPAEESKESTDSKSDSEPDKS